MKWRHASQLVLSIGLLAVPLTASAKGKTYHVVISGMKFTPQTLTVNVGDTVEWTNEDIVPHTATSKIFDSGTLEPGKSWKTTLHRQGAVPYRCHFHPPMTGSIEVK